MTQRENGLWVLFIWMPMTLGFLGGLAGGIFVVSWLWPWRNRA